MAKDINKYAQNIARARYARPSYTAPQRRATIDPSALSGRKAATGAPLASRPIEGGPALPSPQEYNPIIDAESGEDPNAPRVETQQPIESRGGSARYMLQTGGPRLDLSFLVPERVNPAFDPNKAIGGENVPYQESKGVGGFFRRMLGDESNRMNIEAQQAQGAEWRAEAKAAKDRAERKQDIAEEIALREAGPAARFEKTEERLAKSEADRVAAENKRLELEGERLGLTKQQIEDARQDRIARLQLERQQMLDRVTQDQARNEMMTKELELKSGAAGTPQMTGLPGGGLAVMDPRSGSISIVNPGMQGFGTMPGTPATTRQVYPQVKAPAGGGAQVDRATGNTMGGRLPAEAAATTTNASPIVTQPRSATLTDRAINALPFGEAIFDMPRVMTPERTARLEETKRQREAERLKQIKEMQEFQTRDLGPSMF
jgi:hypothetical protein